MINRFLSSSALAAFYIFALIDSVPARHIKEKEGNITTGFAPDETTTKLPYLDRDEVAPPREIRARIYFTDDLYDDAYELLGNDDGNRTFEDEVNSRLVEMFSGINKLLRTLDQGGYRVTHDGTFRNISSSDLKLGESYIDRLDGDRRKQRDNTEHNSWVFLFQEAVQELEEDPEVDIRVLMKYTSDWFVSTSSAEEKCLCNKNWPFGCVAVLSVRSAADWSKTSALFAHEFGHSLGYDIHDDQVYGSESNSDHYIMMSKVYRYATIWSPRARQAIRTMDHSCLERRRTTEAFPQGASP